MEDASTSSNAPEGPAERLSRLPFPPVTKRHILNCSYHSWHPRYRSVTPKARLIPLSDPFLSYLRADGIVLPPEENEQAEWSDSDSGIFSATDNASDSGDDEDADPSAQWRDVHDAIKSTIDELGGKVIPKLNWSAPKDATWINATNSMECRTPNDIYLLLKSSDFVTHDLEHAFDDCVDDEPESIDGQSGLQTNGPTERIPYHLILRKAVTLNPSVEFRCFVRHRELIALCQRDLNHFEFLFKMQDKLRDVLQRFFDTRLRDTFPDENFTFDVYVPPPHNRVWIVDFNPWAPRTDPLLFSWMELLTLPQPLSTAAPETVRFKFSHSSDSLSSNQTGETRDQVTVDESSSSEDEAEELFIPEFRLVRRDDPEAYGFTTPQYSAHKLPKDVVDASRGGESSLREFATQWKEVLAKRQEEDAEDSSDD